MSISIKTSALIIAAIASTCVANAITFNLTQVAGDFSGANGAAALAGFNTAAARWSTLFDDNITINLKIGYHSLGSGSIIGSTGSNEFSTAYSNVRSAVLNDPNRTAVDQSVRNSLPTDLTGANRFLINHPGAASNQATHLYTPTGIGLTTANGKALGLIAANDPTQDASITFNSGFSFSFDPNNVGGSQIDFIGVATHEIGHALGFISTGDDTDGGTSGTDSNYAPDMLDLFRYSTDSGFGTFRDVTADTRVKYFSVDGGVTRDQNGTFSTGVSHGDGRQASHWKDFNPTIGIMDPTASFGQTMAISQLDIDGFDAIGYNRTAVPEPATYLVLGLGLVAVIRKRRSR